MAAESLVQMLEEIAVGLKSGDEEIYGWPRQQLKDCGASEISVELAWGSSPGSCRKRRKRTSRRRAARPAPGSLIDSIDLDAGSFPDRGKKSSRQSVRLPKRRGYTPFRLLGAQDNPTLSELLISATLCHAHASARFRHLLFGAGPSGG